MSAVPVVSSCSAKHDPAAGILLAVDTNLKVPDDIDSIGVSITSAADGAVSEDAMFALAPMGPAIFPATLEVVRGTGNPLQFRAVGYKDGAVIAMREAVTTLPDDHVAVLNLELNWLDKPLVSGTTAESVRSVTTSCPMGQAPIAGTCGSFELDSATLGGFSSAAVVPSTSAAAVDVDDCFGNAQTVTPDPATCSIPPPSGVTDATQVNVALVPAPGHSAGWCNGSSCVVPLPNDPVEGWSLESDGAIHLPPAVCTSAAVQAVVVVPASASCPVLSSSHPAKQDYGTDGGTSVTRDGGDATAPPGDDDGGDATIPTDAGDAGADAAEAGPPPTPFAASTIANVVSIASDGTTIYALVAPTGGSQMVLAELPVDFVDGVSPTLVNIPGPVVATGATVASAAGAGLYAYSDDPAGVPATLEIIPLATPTSPASYSAASGGAPFTDIDIVDNGGSATLTFVEQLATGAVGVGGGTFTKDNDVFAHVASATGGLVASGRVTPAVGGAAEYVFGNSGGMVSTSSTYNGTLAPYGNASPSVTPASFALADGMLATVATNGIVDLVTPQGNGAEFINPGKTSPNTMIGNADILVWISGEAMQQVTYALPSSGTLTEGAYLTLLADGGSPTEVSQILFAGDELVWCDADGVHRALVSTLPKATR